MPILQPIIKPDIGLCLFRVGLLTAPPGIQVLGTHQDNNRLPHSPSLTSWLLSPPHHLIIRTIITQLITKTPIHITTHYNTSHHSNSLSSSSSTKTNIDQNMNSDPGKIDSKVKLTYLKRKIFLNSCCNNYDDIHKYAILRMIKR